MRGLRLLPIVLSASFPLIAQQRDDLDRALAAVKETPAEARWRLVPWETSLTKAFAAAREVKKPVFFFGYDGTLANGNC